MDHGYFKDRVSGYLDGELPDYEMEAMRRHLEECGECRAMCEKLQQVDVLVERHSGLDDGEYWEARARKIEERLGIGDDGRVTDVRGGRRSWLGWKLGAVAATAAVLVFVAINQTGILHQEDGQKMEAPTISTERESGSGAADVAAEATPEVPAQQKEQEVVGRERREAGPIEAERPSEPAANESKRVEQDPMAAAPESRVRVDDEVVADAAEPQPPQAIAKTPTKGDVEQKQVSAGETVAEELSAMLGEADFSRDSAARARALQKSLTFQSERLGTAQPGVEYATYQALSPGARIVAGTLTAPTDLTPSDWVHRRDSLQTRWEEMTGAEKRLTLTGTGRGKTAFTDVSLVERQLIEAHFTAARLAGDEDPEVREEAVRFLTEYTGRPDARYRSTARMYLEQLRPLGEGDE